MNLPPTQQPRHLLWPPPFYYGWVILPIAALAMTATLPGRTHGIGLITKPLIHDLQLSEVTFGDLNFWSIILGAACCWPVGSVMDRFGTRGMITLVVAALGAAVVWTSLVEDRWSLFCVLLLSRGLGQGALSVISTAIVGKWFTRRLPQAMGVFAILLGIGFLGSIIGMGAAIKELGWREAWQNMGWLLLAGLTPLCWIFMRTTPETCGLTSEIAGALQDKTPQLTDLTLRAAVSSPAFWVFTSASCLFGFTWSAVTLFNELILASRGFDRNAFYLVMAVITFVGLLSNLLGGWLATRVSLGKLLAAGMALLAVAIAMFPYVTQRWQLIAYAVAFGISSGLVTVVHFAFHPQAFGRTHLGQIQGLFQVCSVFASALGPALLARVKEWTGDYETLFLAVAPLAWILGVAAALVPLPLRPTLPPAESSS